MIYSLHRVLKDITYFSQLSKRTTIIRLLNGTEELGHNNSKLTQVHAGHGFFEHVVVEDESDESLSCLFQCTRQNMLFSFHLHISTIYNVHLNETQNIRNGKMRYSFENFKDFKDNRAKYLHFCILVPIYLYQCVFSRMRDKVFTIAPIIFGLIFEFLFKILNGCISGRWTG